MSTEAAIPSPVATKPRQPGVGRNTAILAGYTVFETVVVFLLTVVLARYLGAQEYGRLAFALSYALLFSVLADPGIGIAINKLVAISSPERQSRFVANGLALRLALSAMVFGLSVVPIAFSRYLRAIAPLLVVILISEALRNLAIYFCFVFRGHQQNKYEALSMAVERIGCFVAAWILLLMGFRTFTVALVYLGARLASLLVAVTIYSSRFPWTAPHFDRELLQTIRTQTYPLALLMICERVIMSLPPVLVTRFAGEAANGIFKAGFQAVMPAVLLSTSVAASLYAPMAARFTVDPEQSARLFRTGIRGLLHALLPSAVVTVLLSKQIVLFLYGPAYLAAAPVLARLTPYFLGIVFIAVCHMFLPAIDRQKIVGVVSLLSVALLIGSCMVLVPYGGAVGAAWSMAASQLLIGVVYATMAWKYGGASLRWTEWLKMGAAFAAAFAAVALLGDRWSARPLLALVEAGACAAAVYSGIMLLLGGISTEERQALRAVSRRLLPKSA